jgi:hypothetical protein
MSSYLLEGIINGVSVTCWNHINLVFAKFTTNSYTNSKHNCYTFAFSSYEKKTESDWEYLLALVFIDKNIETINFNDNTITFNNNKTFNMSSYGEMKELCVIKNNKIISQENKKNSISNLLQEVSYDAKKMNEVCCPISHGEFEEGEKIMCITKCGHYFMRQPLTQWLQIKQSCPMCNGGL